MVLKVTHDKLGKIIRNCYEKKISLFIFGTFGIGKSVCVKDNGKEIAKERKRKYVEWNKLSKEEKEDVFNNPQNYFVLIDERLSEYDSSDIKGLPDFVKDRETIEWKIPTWTKFLTIPDSDGIVFLDEINLATPLVISSSYKLIYDRIVNDCKINDNWLVIGAGNKTDDRAYTHELPAPVRDRGAEVELVIPSVEDWTNWAIKNGIDSRIITFLNAESKNLYEVDFEDEQKFTTPRGWERVSNLIKDVDDLEIVDLLTKSAIGEGIAIKFIAFCKIQGMLDIDEIIKNPKKIAEIKDIGKMNAVSIKYFVVGSFADKYKEKKIDYNRIMEASKVLDEINNPEFVSLLWRMCVRYRDEFVNNLEKIGSKYGKLVDKYAKVIV